MNKSKLVLLLVLPMLLGACNSSIKKKSSKEASQVEQSSNNTLTSSATTSQQNISSVAQVSSAQPGVSSKTSTNPITSDSQTPPVDSPILGISIMQPYIKANVEKQSSSATVEFYYAEGVDETTVDKSVIWHIGSAAVARVDDYGRVTGISRGKTTLTCTSVVGNKSSTVDVYVLNKNEDFVEKLQKITNTTINVGDDIVIAASEYNVAAGMIDTGSYLHPESITLSSDKTEITDLGNAAMFKVLDDKKGRDGLVLEVPDREGNKFLGTSNTSNVNYYASNNTTQTLWDITWDSSISSWDMRASSATTVDGWMMYNSQHQKFTTYENGVSEVLHLVDIYRMTVIVSL